MTDADGSGLPLIEADDVDPGGGPSAVGGVLLAAGTGSRFEGGNKLLATLDDEPVVWHAGLTLVQAGIQPRVAVLGRDADEVEAVLAGLGFEFVRNPDYADGQATSVRCGVDAVGAVDAAVIALGDMPAVEPSSVSALTAAYRADAGTALAAAYEGRRGNPVLFDRRHFDALRAVEGDAGGREVLLDGDDGALVETGDHGVVADVDTRADLETIRNSQY